MSTDQQRAPDAPEPASSPAPLAGLALPHPSSEQTGGPGAKQPIGYPGKLEGSQFHSFISLVHSYLWSSVTLADQKSAFLFAADSAFLGYLMSDGLIRQLNGSALDWRVVEWLSLTALVFLLLSMSMTIVVMIPRLGGRHEGMIYFRAIASRKTREQYVAEAMSSTDSSIATAVAEHSYELARIAAQKYRYLRTGMWLGVVGFLAGLIFVGLTR